MKRLIIILLSTLFVQDHSYAQLLESKEILAKNQTAFDAQFFNREKQLAVLLKDCIEIYHLNPTEKEYTLKINATAMAVSDQSNLLAVASSKGKVSFYSGDSLTSELRVGDKRVGKIELCEEKDLLACWVSGSEVSVWSIDKASKLWSYPTGKIVINDIAFGMDGSTLLLATSEGAVIICNYENGEIIKKPGVHKGFVRGLAIHPDGIRYASCGDDGRIAIHSVSDEQYYTLEKSHSNFVMDITFLDEDLLMGIGHDHMISMNNINLLPNTASIKNYFYMAKQDKFTGDKYPNTISVSNKNRLVCVSTLGKGIIVSAHVHNFIECSHKVKLGVNHIYSPAICGIDNLYASNMRRCNIGGVVERSESISHIWLYDHYNEARYELELGSNGSFSMEVDLNDKNSRFDLMIEDIDKKLKPVKYSMLIEKQ